MALEAPGGLIDAGAGPTGPSGGYGHTSSSDLSTCINRAVGSYLVRLTTPPRGTVCQPDRRPFDPNFGQPLP